MRDGSEGSGRRGAKRSQRAGRGGVSTGILASGIKLLPLPFCDRRVLEAAIVTSIVGIATKSIRASEEVGSHAIDVGSIDLERGAFFFERDLMEQVGVW